VNNGRRSVFEGIDTDFTFMQTICIKMAWKWGGAKTFTCPDTMTIEEVAEQHGFMDISETTPQFLSRGRILTPEFTLRAHHIHDGQTIIAYLPANVRPLKSGTRRESQCSCARGRYSHSYITGIESAKQADRDFHNWECNRAYPLALAELLRMIEKEDEQSRIPSSSHTTVLAASANISDEPLPSAISSEDFADQYRIHWKDSLFG
jgi:hypothetical protein